MKQQFKRDGRTNDLGQVAGGDPDFGQNPQREARPLTVSLAA
jgi:hypothetical protein